MAEEHIYRISTTATVLSHDKLGLTLDIVAILIDRRLEIIFGAVDEAHDICVLLYRSRFTEVGQLRALVFIAAVFELSVKLRQRYYRDIEFLCQLLERARYSRNFLLAAAQLDTGRHKLQVVNHNQLYAMLAHESARFGAELHHRQT